MSNKKANATKATKPEAKVEEQPSNVVSLTSPAPAASAGGAEPPQSALHAKVLVAMADLSTKLATALAFLHPLAIECMEHGMNTGDLRPLMAFQNNLPKQLRSRLAVAKWAQTFAPIDWGKKDDEDRCTGIKMAKEGSKNYKPWNIAGASQVSFLDARETEPKPTAFLDVIKMLTADNNRIDKCLADPEIKRKNGETDEELKAKKVKNLEFMAFAARAA